MKELVEKLNEAFVTFSEDANLQVEKGNKAAYGACGKIPLQAHKGGNGAIKAKAD